MSWLKDHGYRFCFPSGQPADEHSLWLTFDDGYEDFYLNVFPYLGEFHLKPTVLLVTDCIGGTNAWDEAAGFPSRRLLNKQQILEDEPPWRQVWFAYLDASVVARCV